MARRVEERVCRAVEAAVGTATARIVDEARAQTAAESELLAAAAAGFAEMAGGLRTDLQAVVSALDAKLERAVEQLRSAASSPASARSATDSPTDVRRTRSTSSLVSPRGLLRASASRGSSARPFSRPWSP